MKNTTLSLLLVLFVSACSQKTESTTTNSTEFSIASGDVVSTSVEPLSVKPFIGSEPSSPTQAVSVVFVELSGAKAAAYRQFTKDHLNQKVKILIGTKVVQEQTIVAEDSSPTIRLLCLSPAEAQTITVLLSKK